MAAPGSPELAPRRDTGGREPPTAALMKALVDPTRPTFLFGAVPPREGTTLEAAADIGEKFVARSRALATDGFIVYDIQDEAGRTEDPRPFPFKRTLDPAEYGALLQRRSGKGCVIYKCVAGASDDFDAWMNDAVQRHDHRCFNLVGGATSTVQYSGPSMPEAAAKVIANSASFGCVTIAERHAKKGTEHTALLRKSELGAKWFISQAIYDTEATIKLLHEYGALCRYKNIAPTKVRPRTACRRLARRAPVDRRLTLRASVRTRRTPCARR